MTDEGLPFFKLLQRDKQWQVYPMSFAQLYMGVNYINKAIFEFVLI